VLEVQFDASDVSAARVHGLIDIAVGSGATREGFRSREQSHNGITQALVEETRLNHAQRMQVALVENVVVVPMLRLESGIADR
jgi:hypothetical protein